MLQKKDKTFITCIAIFLAVLAAIAITTISANAKVPNKYGLFKSGGSWYYRYQTTSALHKRGELARDCIKVINGKFYYFKHNGKMQRKDSHYLDIRHRNGSIRYIYITGTHKTQRYNTKLHLRQIKRKGRWRTEEGMPYYPYGQIDWQR